VFNNFLSFIFVRKRLKGEKRNSKKDYTLEQAQITALSPNLTHHINQFCRYDMDLERRPPELVYNLWTSEPQH